MLKEIPRFDYIFWSDGDVIITNPKLSFDDMLSRYPVTEKTTFLITRDSVGNINTGNFFVFNRPNSGAAPAHMEHAYLRRWTLAGQSFRMILGLVRQMLIGRR